MNYTQAEQFLLSLSNMPRKEYMNDPRGCGIYLKRLQLFLDMLGNPEKKIPHYIHVAGTSGKGSLVAMMHAILHAAGKKVGSTYSPHPTYITERWKIGGHFMPRKEFAEIVSFLKPTLDRYLRTTQFDCPSFFEMCEAIGFLYFAKHNVAYVVLEAGCGGRYDSSNVIPWKDAAVITNIGLDHMDILGATKAEIAREKAGIITPACRTFTMERDKKILAIIQRECKKRKAGFHVSRITYHVSQIGLDGTSFTHDHKEYHLPSIGVHQIKNAILAINIARELGMNENAIQKGLSHVTLPIRMEVVSKQPVIILDSAHNPDKIKTTVETIRQITKLPNRQIAALRLIVGFSNNKPVPRMLKQLSTLKPQSIACTRNTVNLFRKVADPKDMVRQFRGLCPKAKVDIFLDPLDALAWSKKQAKKNDVILVTGSVFLAGELRRISR